MAKRWLLIALLVTGAIGLDRVIDSYGERTAEALPGTPGSDLVRSFLGNLSYEIRGTLSRLLYLKIDRYVHEGKKIDLGGGVLGVTAVDNTEIVPLYGIITYLDPHFIEAFSFGANHLMYGLEKQADGLALLQLGIARNPDDPLTSELLGQLGVYYLRDANEPARAIPVLERALQLRRRIAEEETPTGFVFSAPQIVGLLATANYRAGNREAAIRWLGEPHNLDESHEIFGLLGVKPPPPEARPPVRQLEHHDEAAHEPRAARRIRYESPLWWRDEERRGAFLRSLATGAVLALVLSLPLWGRIARLRG